MDSYSSANAAQQQPPQPVPIVRTYGEPPVAPQPAPPPQAQPPQPQRPAWQPIPAPPTQPIPLQIPVQQPPQPPQSQVEERGYLGFFLNFFVEKYIWLNPIFTW